MSDREPIRGVLDLTAATAVRDDVKQRLITEGWHGLEAEPDSPTASGALCSSLSADLSVVVWILPWVGGVSTGSPELSVAGLVGFDYGPARRVTSSLVGRAYSGVALNEPTRMFSLETVETGQVSNALVDFASEHKAHWERAGAVDIVIDVLKRGEAIASINPREVLGEGRNGDEDRTAVTAALLATNGRYDEALRALSKITIDGGNPDVVMRRFIRQMTRWIESRGTLELPTSPAHWRWRAPARVIKVGATSFALSNRPIGQPGKRRVAMEGIKAIAGFLGEARAKGGGLERILRDVPDEESEGMALSEERLPEKAAYPMCTFGEPLSVAIDSTATQLLENILADRRPTVDGSVEVQVWLRPSENTPGSLEVIVGGQRVGQLSGEQAMCFAAPIAAAADRDEFPWTRAALRRGSGDDPISLALPGAATPA
jgi:hypothetical protein